jgi:hypothetical protein
VHGNPLKMSIDRGQQTDHFYFAPLAENVETPGTIFAAAPGEKDSWFQGEMNSLKINRNKERRGRVARAATSR